MAMMEELEKSGNFLFRLRSYFPLLFFVIIFMVIGNFGYPYGSHYYDLIWEIFCLFVGVFGMVIRVMTVGFVPEGTSARGTGKPFASRLNTTGMYSVVRNPLYLGNFFTYIAPVLFIRSWQVAALFVLAFIVYYERIIFAEEAFLRKEFGSEYIEWSSKTPAFFPNFFKWIRPDLRFSWKMAVSREYHGVYGLVCAMLFIELLTDFYIHRALVFDSFWVRVFAAATVFYATARFLDKKTKLLVESGR